MILLPQFEKLFVVAFGPLLLVVVLIFAARAWRRMKNKGAAF